MIFSLDVRRARKGDCLLLHFGTKGEPGLAMIDGGPKSVYAPFLKPRLAEIKKSRKLADGVPLFVDLLMVSHVDDDHIQGILDFTRELQATPEAASPVRVGSIWHNSFDDVIGNTPDELTAAVAAQFGAASLNGELPDNATLDVDEEEEVVVSTLKVLASIAQGHRLRDDANVLGFVLNPEFGQGLVLGHKEPLTIADGLTFTVAGPMQPELLALQQKHDEWLEQQQKKKSDGAAALAAYVDKSVPNLSSIVVLARSDGKSMLLTGDARGDKILEGLETVGVLEAGKTMHVDVLKVPHHGSSNNLDHDFFERITADHYVFSGNGEHGNPEREAFEMLLAARVDDPFEIHLTYPIDEIDVARKADWEKEQAKEKVRKAKGGKKEPREDWSPIDHSLAAFFTPGRLKSGQALRIVDEKQPHVIDLLDPLGF
jgi:hypothetical protein